MEANLDYNICFHKVKLFNQEENEFNDTISTRKNFSRQNSNTNKIGKHISNKKLKSLELEYENNKNENNKNENDNYNYNEDEEFSENSFEENDYNKILEMKTFSEFKNMKQKILFLFIYRIYMKN